MKVKQSRRSVIISLAISMILIGAALLVLQGIYTPSTPAATTPATEAKLSGWQNLNGITCYFDPATGEKHTGWLELPEGTYFLDDNGAPTTGLFPCPQGCYYFDAQGRMVTGWAETPDGKRYFAEDGTMTVGFLDLDGNHYCFTQSGILCIGWHAFQDQRFYFDESGILISTPGWLYTDDGTWYLQEDGQPYTGWMQTDEARYYFLEDGAMAVGSVLVGDTWRYFSSDGNYIPLINPWNKVPEDYQLNLITLENRQVDATCAESLKAMLSAARNAGLTCELDSTYRDIKTQTYLWDYRYNDYLSLGYSAEEAYQLSARRVAYPGTSEHHTGLALDIMDLAGDGKLYEWFREHAWEYGFIVRYDGDKEALTGIRDEPWHLRYVGKEVAQVIQENDWCLEEFMNQFPK